MVTKAPDSSIRCAARRAAGLLDAWRRGRPQQEPAYSFMSTNDIDDQADLHARRHVGT